MEISHWFYSNKFEPLKDYIPLTKSAFELNITKPQKNTITTAHKNNREVYKSLWELKWKKKLSISTVGEY